MDFNHQPMVLKIYFSNESQLQKALEKKWSFFEELILNYFKQYEISSIELYFVSPNEDVNVEMLMLDEVSDKILDSLMKFGFVENNKALPIKRFKLKQSINSFLENSTDNSLHLLIRDCNLPVFEEEDNSMRLMVKYTHLNLKQFNFDLYSVTDPEDAVSGFLNAILKPSTIFEKISDLKIQIGVGIAVTAIFALVTGYVVGTRGYASSGRIIVIEVVLYMIVQYFVWKKN